MELYLFRHGKTWANLERRYQGRTDEGLCEQGVRELRERRKSGLYPVLEEGNLLAVSPMKRCLQTARLLYPQKRGMVIPELREIDFGAFEGKNYQELSGDRRYQAWIDSGGRLPFPEGEDRCGFIRRTVAGLRKLERERRVVLIAHGGTLMAILSELGGGDYFAYSCANGDGYVCEWTPGDRPEITEIRPLTFYGNSV